MEAQGRLENLAMFLKLEGNGLKEAEWTRVSGPHDR